MKIKENGETDSDTRGGDTEWKRRDAERTNKRWRANSGESKGQIKKRSAETESRQLCENT